jgi:hypothetical protein
MAHSGPSDGENMAVFYSFHYDRDSWRVQQVINMGALEGQPLLKPQEWEEAKKKAGGIEKWIELSSSSSERRLHPARGSSTRSRRRGGTRSA